jgi:hypothetical protein
VSHCNASARNLSAGNLVACLAIAASVLLLGGNAVRATSYASVTFDELVARADVIFVGEVTDVRPFPLNTRDGTVVKTRVVFRVSDPLWGTTNALEVLDFLGGEWGDIGMVVAEMPRFAVGDRRVVFARREQSINPIVGFTQGLLQISRDSSGVDRLFTLGGAPLGQPEQIGSRSLTDAAIPIAPMPLSTFRNRVDQALTGM